MEENPCIESKNHYEAMRMATSNNPHSAVITNGVEMANFLKYIISVTTVTISL
jgi:hypothetical protein